MANRIDKTFCTLKRAHRKALIGYITAGHPTRGSLFKLIPLLAANGVDIVELGVPFSDPIADGPTIQRSSQIALRQGTTLSWILREVKKIRRVTQVPLVLMSYCNPLYAMGIPEFFRAAESAGVDGVIIPDLIPEESRVFTQSSRRTKVHLIHLVAPTSSRSRLQTIGQATRGFLYAVSLTGVTGARRSMPSDVKTFLRQVARSTRVPVAVGFGISSPEQARVLSHEVDGIIVGSALVSRIESSHRHKFSRALRFVRALRIALDTTTH